MRSNVPTAVRALRRIRRWRQVDLGERARLSRDSVSRAELGDLRGLTVGTLERLAAALGATLVVELRWQGADLDRVIDRAHAVLQAVVVSRLRSAGWVTHVEVSFNHYGDRGRCDVVGWHPRTGTVLIVEVKSRLANLQETLGHVDVKRRLGGAIAQQLGYLQPRSVAIALVLGDARTARRTVERHSALFDAFAVRGRSALAWVRQPTGAGVRLLWFEALPNSGEGRTNDAQRVRTDRPAGSQPQETPSFGSEGR